MFSLNTALSTPCKLLSCLIRIHWPNLNVYTQKPNFSFSVQLLTSLLQLRLEIKSHQCVKVKVISLHLKSFADGFKLIHIGKLLDKFVCRIQCKNNLSNQSSTISSTAAIIIAVTIPAVLNQSHADILL